MVGMGKENPGKETEKMGHHEERKTCRVKAMRVVPFNKETRHPSCIPTLYGTCSVCGPALISSQASSLDLGGRYYYISFSFRKPRY
jgi:hypothetical protein